MKIYILPIHPRLRPDKQIFKYPQHNHDFGVEQDFYDYLKKNRDLISNDPNESDWHYLPVFWTRWHLNHDYGRRGLDELDREINKSVLDDGKTFTICQYDDGPVVDLGKTTIFLASRQDESGIDIPLLCSPHKRPLLKPKKQYLASFVGRLSTHPIRNEIASYLQNRKDIFICDSNSEKGAKFYVRKILESYVTICPRGYGGSSFRFFETMQLGIVPFLIGDLDTRPFKKFINWDEISFFSDSPKKLLKILDSRSTSDLIAMGKKAALVWKRDLKYKQWCDYAVKELL